MEVSVSSEETKQNSYQLNVRAPIMTSSSVLFLAFVFYAVLFDKYDFSSYERSINGDLKQFGVKCEFVLRQSTPAVIWILVCVFCVTTKRATTAAVMPGSRHEYLIAENQRILQNSLEQFVLHIFSQLIMVSYIDQDYLIIKLVPTFSFLFILGRILFFLGYPTYRAVGFLD